LHSLYILVYEKYGELKDNYIIIKEEEEVE